MQQDACSDARSALTRWRTILSVPASSIGPLCVFDLPFRLILSFCWGSGAASWPFVVTLYHLFRMSSRLSSSLQRPITLAEAGRLVQAVRLAVRLPTGRRQRNLLSRRALWDAVLAARRFRRAPSPPSSLPPLYVVHGGSSSDRHCSLSSSSSGSS